MEKSRFGSVRFGSGRVALIGVAVIGVILLVLWSGIGGAVPAAPAAPDAVLRTTSAAETSTGGIGATGSEPARSVAATHAAGASVGLARDAWSVQVIDAETSLPVVGASASAATQPAWSAVANADGRFALPRDLGADARLTVSAVGYQPRRLIVDGRFGPPEVLALQPGLRTELRVLDAVSREPVPDVGVHVERLATERRVRGPMTWGETLPHVALEDATARTDANGVVALALPPTDFCTVVLVKIGHAPQWIERLAGGAPSTTVLLDPAPPVEVLVVDAAGVAIAGAPLRLSMETVSVGASTDVDGRCTLPGGPSGTTASIDASPAGGVGISRMLAQMTRPVRAEVVFPVAEPVVLRDDRARKGALSVRWEPLPGPVRVATIRAPLPASLGLEPTDELGVDDLQIVDGMAGQAYVRRAGDVSEVIALTSDWYARSSIAGRDEVVLAATIPADAELTVVVTDLDTGADVEVWPLEPGLRALVADPPGPLWCRAAEAGRARFDGVVPGRYAIRVAGRAEYRSAIVEVRGVATAALQPQLLTTVTGRVVTDDVGVEAPAAAHGDLVVTAEEVALDAVLGAAHCERDGSFRLTDLPAGRLRLRVRPLDPAWIDTDTFLAMRAMQPETVEVPPEGLHDVRLAWPFRGFDIEVRAPGAPADRSLQAILYREFPFDRVGRSLEAVERPVHAAGVATFRGLNPDVGWIAAIVSPGRNGFFGAERVLPGTTFVQVRCGDRLPEVRWMRDGPATLFPMVDERTVLREIALPVVDGGDGVRRWRDLPPGRYALRTADVSGPLTGPLGRHTQVDVTPTTRRLP